MRGSVLPTKVLTLPSLLHFHVRIGVYLSVVLLEQPRALQAPCVSKIYSTRRRLPRRVMVEAVGMPIVSTVMLLLVPVE